MFLVFKTKYEKVLDDNLYLSKKLKDANNNLRILGDRCADLEQENDELREQLKQCNKIEKNARISSTQSKNKYKQLKEAYKKLLLEKTKPTEPKSKRK